MVWMALKPQRFSFNTGSVEMGERSGGTLVAKAPLLSMDGQCITFALLLFFLLAWLESHILCPSAD